jgi:hypothetical protein
MEALQRAENVIFNIRYFLKIGKKGTTRYHADFQQGHIRAGSRNYKKIDYFIFLADNGIE